MTADSSARQPAVAGAFYPGNAKQLQQALFSFLTNAAPSSSPKGKEALHAIIVPHAGYIYSGLVAAAAYRLVRESGSQFSRAIILGPSHFVPVQGGAFDDHPFWRTPLGVVPVENFSSSRITLDRAAHAREHSLEVQVPFIQAVLPLAAICPIALGVSGEAGRQGTLRDDIMSQLDGKTLLVVSSDLSHYHPYADAVAIDHGTIGRILSLEEIDEDEACGAAGIDILIAIARKKNWKPVLLDYKNSGDTAGDKDAVVGYAAVAFVS